MSTWRSGAFMLHHFYDHDYPWMPYLKILWQELKNDMKTAQKIANNLINENIFPLKVSSLRQDVWYLGIVN